MRQAFDQVTDTRFLTLAVRPIDSDLGAADTRPMPCLPLSPPLNPSQRHHFFSIAYGWLSGFRATESQPIWQTYSDTPAMREAQNRRIASQGHVQAEAYCISKRSFTIYRRITVEQRRGNCTHICHGVSAGRLEPPSHQLRKKAGKKAKLPDHSFSS